MAEIKALLILRFGTTEQWNSIERIEGKVLQQGELGYDTDLHLLKVGDGINKWSSLPAVNDKEFSSKFVSEIKTGDEISGKGTFKYTINNVDTVVKVYGLGSAAYTEVADYATAQQGAKADSAIQSVSIGNEKFTDDGSHNVSLTPEKVREILDLYTKSEVETQINTAIETHNTSEDAHEDIRTKIEEEASTREQEDSSLSSRIDSVKQSQTEGNTQLQEKINQEIKDREAADKTLQNQLGAGFDETNTVKKAIEDLTAQQSSDKSDLEAKLKAETDLRTEEDKKLQDQLGTGFDSSTTVKSELERLESELTSKASDLQTKLEEEASRATTSEKAIQDQLGDGFSSDNTVAKAIEEAKEQSSTAVQDVSKKLQEEITRATNSETSLEGKIDAEISRAQAVEQANKKEIDNNSNLIQQNTEKINTNTQNIQQNADGLAAEIKRAKGVEGELTALTTSNKDSLVSAINSEVEARKQADNTLTNTVTSQSNKIKAIENKIPAQANATNQLADKDFVNSSIAAQASRFITPSADRVTLWSSFEALESGPWYYEGEVIDRCENNDYATYLVPATEEGTPAQQWRAIYQKNEPIGEPGGKWVAAYQYNTVWTARQKAAIDSGITEELVAKIGTNETNISEAQSNITQLQSDVGSLQTDVDDIQSNVGTLQSDVSTLKTDVNELKTDVSGLKTDVAGLKTDTTQAKSDILELQSNVTEAKSDITDLQSGLESYKSEFDSYKSEVEDKYAPKVSPTFTGSVTVPSPSLDTDAATKKYVDDLIKEATGEEAGSTDEKIKRAIEGLDASIEEVENKYISSITQADGVISASQKDLPVTEVVGTAPISVDNSKGVFTVSHDTKEVTPSTDASATNIVTSVTADTTGHLSGYVTNTLEDALKALGIIEINGGKATDLIAQ